ncbi:MAG: hypothetical protein ABMB14_30505 [Myxococcota bacterium]
MTTIGIVSLIGCITSYTHTEQLGSRSALPEIDADCTPSVDDVVVDGARVVSVVELLDEEDGVAGCSAAVYASAPLVDWTEVQADLEESVPFSTKVLWMQTFGQLNTLAVHTPDGDLAPVGTHLLADQLLVGADTLAGLEDAPLDQLVALRERWTALYPQHLLGFGTVLDGTETDLAEVIHLDAVPPGPVDELNASWATDDALSLVTVASVIVPLDQLAGLPPTELVLELDETIRLTAGVAFEP